MKKYCRFSSMGVLNNFLNQTIWVLRFISGCWMMQPKMQGLQGKVDIHHSPKETGTGHQMQNGRCRRQQFPSKHCPDPNLQPLLTVTFLKTMPIYTGARLGFSLAVCEPIFTVLYMDRITVDDIYK
ncbi:hypothetical protein ES332_D05G231200v1 [Gossypium tomentosum]|uniref:Uncharacterized protein n=2 Tax=Gossypium TaxID=3633 RepID=A0A5D2KYE4_GOSTO|nr:hypothetical protein ES332_D05G231200v1 [Gossypium tomentosum]